MSEFTAEELRIIAELDAMSDVSSLDSDDIREIERIDLDGELRNRARALGVKNVARLSRAELEARIVVMLRVRAEGLSRLEFDDREPRQLLPTLENLRILQIPAVEKKSDLTRADVIRKLQGYRLITNKLNTNNRRWTRYIDIGDGFLRPGGFPIQNKPADEFIVMKNVSKKFTFSIKRDNVILMEKIPAGDDDLLDPRTRALVDEFNAKPRGNIFIVMSGDLSTFHSNNSAAAISRDSGFNRGSLSRAFRNNLQKFKKTNFLFKLSPADVTLLNNRRQALGVIPFGNGIPPDLMAVINRFY